MTGPEEPRPFVAPFLGLVLLFAALGPLIGAVTFVPLAIALKARAAAGAAAFAASVVAVFGHSVLVVAAYLIGVGPATATGTLYALWDALTPRPWPRALVAATIGGCIAYLVALRLAAIGASLDALFDVRFDLPHAQSISWTAPVGAAPAAGVGLIHAFVASGAIAGLVCAMAASLLGLSMQPASNRPRPEGTP
jgi:hypothetical protein